MATVLHIAKMTGIAGTEKHLLTLLPGLKARGLDVRLLILEEPAIPMHDYAAQMQSLGVQAERTLIRRNIDLPLFKHLRQYIRSMQPAAVHTHLIHADLHGVIAARRAGVERIFLTCHNDDPFRKTWKIRRMMTYLWPRITRAIAISDWIRRHAIEVEKAPPEKVVTIHHGVDVGHLLRDQQARTRVRASLNLPPDAIVFGSICRLIEQKGVGDAIDAFAVVAKKATTARYVIAGDGELRSALEKQVQTAGLANRVQFLGWRSDAADVMAALDVFVNPSRWEGFGLVVLEAMAASLPVIATNVSALPEIVVDGVTGRLTPPRDINALAKAMLEMCELPEAARQMGRAGKLRVETEFNAARMIDQTIALYALP